MADKPILIFPASTASARQKLDASFGGPIKRPTQAQQRQRLTQRFKAVLEGFGTVQTETAGLDPEQVVVFETVGSVADFQSVVKKIGGMEWLGDFEVDVEEPDEGFLADGTDTQVLPGRLFVVLSNQAKLSEIVKLWNAWCKAKDEKLDRGYGKLAEIFKHLNDVRPWAAKDRVQQTGVVGWWEDSIGTKQPTVRFEAELWCRGDPQARTAAFARVNAVVTETGGRCVTDAAVPEIEYHGVLIDLPSKAVRGMVRAIKAGGDTKLLRQTDVMYFSPMGQASVAAPGETTPDTIRKQPPPAGDPVVAILDGAPLENHEALRGRLRLDDPDSFASQYNAGEQHHGTAMASLVIHGDLDAQGTPLPKPVYVRPIMVPGAPDQSGKRRERLPSDQLPVDLTFRAVRRLFEPSSGAPPVAPTVRVINLSIGDQNQLFDREMSPWAKLLDWLSWKYQVLFVVSAGNHRREITIEASQRTHAALSDGDLRSQVLQAMERDRLNRRLLAPSESVNALTIGSVHADASTPGPTGYLRDLLRSGRLPSPISTVSGGFRRSIKPEVLMPGGRVLYDELALATPDAPATFGVSEATKAPGQKVAAPGPTAGVLNHTTHTRGTSNAAALASRAAARFYDLLIELRREPGGQGLTDRFAAVVLKAMLVHGASWAGAGDFIAEVFQGTDDGVKRWNRLKRVCAQFLGYGEVDLDRVSVCTDQRVIMLGCGELEAEQAHVYQVPVPTALGAQKVRRRLAITLAWFTPANTRHRAYRVADLWFEPPLDQLGLARQDAHHDTVTRGTVQHEILEGDAAKPIAAGDTLPIQINCRPDAGTNLTDPVPYGLMVSLEVAKPLSVSIYDQVRVALDQLREAARIRAVVGVGSKGR